MTDQEKAKLVAAGKIALGTARMASAVATATGHGIIGGFCRNHHGMRLAFHLGKLGLKGGREQFEEGLADWKRADS
jgi:hypothetical protein